VNRPDLSKMKGFDPKLFTAYASQVGHGGALGILYSDHGPDWVELALDHDEKLIGVTKTGVIDAALSRAGARTADPIETLTALGSADLAAATGYLLAAAQDGVPVLLDGLISVSCALTADRIEAGAAEWFAAGHRSTEPAQSLALAKLGLEPLLDLGMRLGEGSGAVAAVPVLHSAGALLRNVALLSDLGV